MYMNKTFEWPIAASMKQGNYPIDVKGIRENCRICCI